MNLNSVDPNWAWSAFEPSADTPWNRAAAAHLFRRVAFGASSRRLDEAVVKPPSEVVRQLVRGEKASANEARDFETLADTVAASGNPEGLAAWWLHRMIHTSDPALEKLTLFWHGHFATSGAKVREADLMLAQNRMIRTHAWKVRAVRASGVAPIRRCCCTSTRRRTAKCGRTRTTPAR